MHFWIITISFLLLFPFLRLFIIQYIHLKAFFIPSKEGYYGGVLLHEFLNSAIISSFSIFIKIFFDWIKKQKVENEIINQKQASELALLRMQINPHFLFNTLNNIYYLTYSKSEMAPSAVMKLADIMRYMLYEANTDKVVLQKEIDYIQSFIDLTMLRYKNQNFIEFKAIVERKNIMIAPMLFVPLVENAFKHGIKNDESKKIEIIFQEKSHELWFSVKNFYSRQAIENDAEQGIGGVGLTNIKRRLDLLYPNKHKLIIDNEDNIYQVSLVIQI